MYNIYIWFKTIINKIIDNISPLKKEMAFIIDNFETMSMLTLKKAGVEYKQDLLGKTQWDWQFSTDKLVQRKGGDCNSIMRAFQAYYYLKGFNAYLVTIVADDPAKCHATCILKKDNAYFVSDYDDFIECSDYADCINTVQKKYNIHRVVNIVAQDIRWKIVKGI